VVAPPTPESEPLRLVDILRAIPASELTSLITRLGARIDPQKRLDPAAQMARLLAASPEVRDPSLLPPASADLLRRVAEARGSLVTKALPPGIEALSARGIAFVRGLGQGKLEVIVPSAHLVQLRSWEGEDPRGIRALLAQASFETLSAVAAHYLGRPATPPVVLALEPAWEVLSDPVRLAEEVGRLSPAERRLLEGVDREGGEVETDELLDLEREPMRLRSATGSTPSRRGAGFALERRGMLIPVHPGRHVVPSEVAAIIGGARSAEQAARREAIRHSVLATDYLPRRARFSESPAPLAMALAMAMREPSPSNEVRSGIGTPKSLMVRLGHRFGRDTDRIALLAALSRASGLWETSAMSPASPPGSWTMGELGYELFCLWRRGGAWDEARIDAETFRVAADTRDVSPSGVLRELLLDAIRDLGEGHWVPWSALETYVRDDARTPGVTRILRRWADRAGLPAPSPVDVARRMAEETLPALGVLDLGEAEEDADDDGRARSRTGSGEGSFALRLTARGRAWLAGPPSPDTFSTSEFLAEDSLVVGDNALVSQVLALAAFAEIGRAQETLELTIAPQAIARALTAGLDPDSVRARLKAVAPLSSSVSQLLSQASVVLGRAAYVPAAGFLWVDDASVRELLQSRKGTAELFVDPSPPGGLLLAPGVDIARVVRRARPLGVEITHDGRTLRVASQTETPPPGPALPERKGRTASSASNLRRTEG
jgi:hypothetical protein